MEKNSISVNQNLVLPCGETIKNRIAKSAMSENMASLGKANLLFKNVYQRWAKGGAGLLITGNVMIDSSARGEPNNIIIEKNNFDIESLREWAKAASQDGTHVWMQLNHPGKQSPKFLSPTPVAPSAIEFPSPMNQLFNKPRELSTKEIEDIIKAFGFAALKAQEAGFTGVQIHAAHGYLISQFLSPLHNQRRDQWGGSLENRMRFLISVYKEIRTVTGHKFPIGVKLNSTDFQKGGFSQEDSLYVIQKLSELGVDLIEISGGTYEAPAMVGTGKSARSSSREAYFLNFAELARKATHAPLMLTGGFRTIEGMEEALASGAVDMIGLGRSLVLDPELPKKILSGENVTNLVKPLTTGIKALDKIVPLEIIWYTNQIHRMGKGKDPNAKLSTWYVTLKMFQEFGIQSLKRVRVK